MARGEGIMEPLSHCSGTAPLALVGEDADVA